MDMTAKASSLATPPLDDNLSKEVLIARIELLRSQLDPDFLFNTLNSLSGLVLAGRNADADRMIGNLARYLRAPSASDEPALITLTKEMGLAQAFLEIEALRLDHPASVSVDMTPELATHEVPCLILLPLVAAVVRQGRDAAPVQSTIALVARPSEAGIIVKLEQRFSQSTGADASRFREAIEPLCTRLAMMYGSSDGLEIDFGAGHISACLHLPTQ